MSQKFQELIQSERPILIDFFATWCQPCKVQSSVLNSVKEQVSEKARIVKIDIDQFPSIANEYNVRGVPTLAVFKNGEMLWKESGVHDVNSLVGVLEQYSN
ncbi:MAG: thioredoxin family protein [Weeksellaceae bacterium]|nr:thioredoxin family protein [Weeksellaceae bacterium]